MIRTFLLGLACMLFAGHIAAAAVNSCGTATDGQCSAQAEIQTAAAQDTEASGEPAGSPFQEHKSQCQDHCKSSGQTPALVLLTESHAHEPPLPAALAQLAASILRRPPR